MNIQLTIILIALIILAIQQRYLHKQDMKRSLELRKAITDLVQSLQSNKD